jgi:hypothetical protein
MAMHAWVQKNFAGGQAIDKKVGSSNSFAYSQSLDFRKSPSQMSVLPATRRCDGGVVTDLVQNEVMTLDGTIYAVGDAGNVYQVTPAGVWSLFGTISAGTYGILYRADQDAIYIASATTVSLISTVAANPTLQADYYASSKSLYDNTTQMGFNVNSNQSGSALTTAIKVSGGTNDKRYFQTDVQPIEKIGIAIVAKGTGNWTLAVKDGIGNVLGTKTIANASLNNTATNYFTFTTPIPVNVGPNNAQTYNFELTSTVADGTVKSTTTNSLLTCDMELWANRLQTTNNGIHSMIQFQQFVIIGNGRYLSVWEPLGDAAPANDNWQRQKLVIPTGYEICGLTVFNEYLCVAAEKVTTGTNTAQEGIIFYWDGLSDTYNYFTKIPEGSPRGISEYENVVFYVAGGNWYAISSVAATPTKVRKLPFSENVYSTATTSTKVNPYNATTRYGIQLIGWPSTTTNTLIPYGVYSFGRVDSTQPNSFGYSYLISTGTQYYTAGNDLKIGQVTNFGNTLHISWHDSGTFGVDIIDASSTPATTAIFESLILDMGMANKDKMASHVMAKWNTIQAGVSIRLKYSIDRGAWVYSEYFTNANMYMSQTNHARFDVGTSSAGARFYEIQCGIEVTCDGTVTSPPEITELSLVYDDLNTESLI